MFGGRSTRDARSAGPGTAEIEGGRAQGPRASATGRQALRTPPWSSMRLDAQVIADVPDAAGAPYGAEDRLLLVQRMHDPRDADRAFRRVELDPARLARGMSLQRAVDGLPRAVQVHGLRRGDLDAIEDALDARQALDRPLGVGPLLPS